MPIQNMKIHHRVNNLLSTLLLFHICNSLSMNNVAPSCIKTKGESLFLEHKSAGQTNRLSGFVYTRQLMPTHIPNSAKRLNRNSCWSSPCRLSQFSICRTKMVFSDALGHQLREEFPALKQTVHDGKPLVYLDRSERLQCQGDNICSSRAEAIS